jgi:pilus assembly protein Flp/PilA
MINQYINKLEWLKNEEGQDLAEYGLLLGLIAVVVMVAVGAIGGSIFEIFDFLTTAADGWSGGGTA